MITIFTPTYNRCHTLERLYKSLIIQTFTNFEWLIVDDGSRDATEALINSFISEGKIPIRYYKQQNGGKHRAINYGVELAKGELFFIVDSDDYLLSTALNFINEKSCLLDKNIVAIAARRCFENGKIIGKEFTNNFFVSNHIIKTNILNYNGDLAEVIKTEILKKYKFPEIDNEIFCAESLIWNRIANDGYLTCFFNNPIYVCEYLEEGLTFNNIKIRKNNPNYALIIYSELFKINVNYITNIKSLINFWRFSFYSKKTYSEKFKMVDYKLLSIFCLPLGALFYLIDHFKK